MRRDSRRRDTPAVRRSADFGALLLCALGTVTAFAQAQPPLPPARPPELSSPPKSQEAPPTAPAALAPSSPPAAPSAPPQAAADACLEELKANRVEAEAAAAPGNSVNECRIAAPVQITSVGLPGGAKLDLPAHPLLDCSFAVAFTGFLRDLVGALGDVMLGASVVALDTGPGYYCRSVDRVPGAKVSPHGKGVAIDVSAILLADRRALQWGMRRVPRRHCSCRRYGARAADGSRPYWGPATRITPSISISISYATARATIIGSASSAAPLLFGRHPT